jgi:hypothetical protein
MAVNLAAQLYNTRTHVVFGHDNGHTGAVCAAVNQALSAKYAGR